VAGGPLERDPALVVKDLADGFVSVEWAKKGYGVVVRVVDDDLGEYEVDVDANRRFSTHRSLLCEPSP
jgi:N-methylhydantoinase B